MFIHDINPVLLQIGPLQIRYYGIIYVIGFIIAYYLIRYLGKKRNIITEKQTSDFILYLIIGAILGARLFYVLVYNLPFYIQNPLQIFSIWTGGLSFHGGLIGSIIAGYLFTKKYKINFLKLADITIIPLAIGLSLGRIGNFINGELYGRITNLPWGFKFPGAEGSRHPSQLYESAKNLIIFFILWHQKEKKHSDGHLFFLFIILYSSFRFFIEFFREPDLQIGFIGPLTLGQVINLPMFFIGLYFIIKINKKTAIN